MRLAAIDGLEGITIGRLASDLEMSKSGVFAHFRSKEALQVATDDDRRERFAHEVIAPALREARGEARVQSLLERWLTWASSTTGGCIFVSASAEFDDRPGRVREVLVESQEKFHQVLARSARVSMDEGHFHARVDPDQFAFELYSVMLGAHYYWRLIGDRDALRRARRSFQRLLDDARA